MEDLEGKLRGILSDPEAMAGIASMARGLGLQLPGDGPEAPPAEPQSGGLPDTVAGLLSAARSLDGRQTALLQALRPFLQESRRRKLDRAIQAARISRIAGHALRSLDTPEKEGEGHV